MPTNRTRRPRKHLPELSPLYRALLLELDQLPDADELERFDLLVDGDLLPGHPNYERSLHCAWHQHRDALLPEWKRRHGDRPHPLDGDLASAKLWAMNALLRPGRHGGRSCFDLCRLVGGWSTGPKAL